MHHHAVASAQHRSRIAWAFFITITVMVVEVIGGLWSGSLALLSDAAHMLTDAIGLAIALGASWLATRSTRATHTFGWKRIEVLAALANSLIVATVATTLIIEGIQRLQHPQPVDTNIIIIAASIGLVANAISLRLLHAGSQESVNVRGAYLEVLGDLIGSVVVIIAAVIIHFSGITAVDAIASILIGLLILPRAWALLQETLNILLESTPKDIDIAEVAATITSIPGVIHHHDLHVWTITSGVRVLTAHIALTDTILATPHEAHRVKEEIRAVLQTTFHIDHITLETEPYITPDSSSPLKSHRHC